MAVEYLNSQYGYNGPDYFDGKIMRASYDVLINTASTDTYIPITSRFVGLTVTLQNLNSSIAKTADVWLVGGTSDTSWKLKAIQPLNTIEQRDLLPFNLLAPGFEVVVLNGGDIKKYRLTKKVSKPETGVTWTELTTGGKDYDAEIAALQNSINNVSAATTGLVNNLREQIDVIGDDIDTLQNNIDNVYAVSTSGDTFLQDEVDVLSGAVDDINERLDNIKIMTAETITKKYYYKDKDGNIEEVATEEEAKEKADTQGGSYSEVTTNETVYMIDVPVSGSDMEE